MKFIESLREGEHVSEVYLCKQKQTYLTKAGRPYDSLILQDKTGVLDAKIWEVGSPGIEDFSALDYVYVVGDITSFQGKPQMNVKRAKRVSDSGIQAADYLPVSEKDIPKMYQQLLDYVNQIKDPWLKQLVESFFGDPEFSKRFMEHSAAKMVHHGFVGGLVEHTLNVTQTCDFFCGQYPIMNRDLLLSAAMFHDIGKMKEISEFPRNDYTDEGQLIGHIVIGAMEVQEHIAAIPDFPEQTASELIHCILSHHGELEYGSPKKPALIEAVALSFADNADAKLETMKEALSAVPEGNTDWLGFNRLMDTNIRRTGKTGEE